MKKKPAKNLIGQKFGRLTVIEFKGIKNFWKDRRESYWKVRCDCGNEKILRISNLRNTKSCGCLLNEFRKIILPKKTSERNSKPLGSAAKHCCYKSYINRSKKKKINFEFTKEEFLELTQKNCYYCGRKPRTIIKTKVGKRIRNGSFTYNGLDRIDSTKGYLKNNILTCCEICNKAKRDMPQNDFLEWINDLIEYRSNYAKSS
jgi:hypothetical protein